MLLDHTHYYACVRCVYACIGRTTYDTYLHIYIYQRNFTVALTSVGLAHACPNYTYIMLWLKELLRLHSICSTAAFSCAYVVETTMLYNLYLRDIVFVLWMHACMHIAVLHGVINDNNVHLFQQLRVLTVLIWMKQSPNWTSRMRLMPILQDFARMSFICWN